VGDPRKIGPIAMKKIATLLKPTTKTIPTILILLQHKKLMKSATSSRDNSEVEKEAIRTTN